MSRIKGYTHITSNDYKQIKLMLDAKIPVSTIKSITKRGSGTVYNIKNTSSFDEYKGLQREYWIRKSNGNLKLQTKDPITQGVGTDVHGVTSTVPDGMADGNSLGDCSAVCRELRAINETLQQLVAAWESAPRTRRLF